MKNNIQLPSEKVLENFVEEIFTDYIDELELFNIEELSHSNLIGLPPEKYDFIGHDVYRQVALGGYGILDVLCVYRYVLLPNGDDVTGPKEHHIAVVIELKNTPLKCENINQVFRYFTAIKNLNIYDNVFPVLIGTGVDNCHYILNETPNHFRAYTFSVGVKGIEFVIVSGDGIGKYHLDNGISKEDFLTHLYYKKNESEQPF